MLARKWHEVNISSFATMTYRPAANLIELHSRNLMEPGEGAATFGVYVERKKLPPQPRTCVILPYGPMLDSWENDVPKGTTDSRRDGNMSMSRKFAFEVGLFDDAYIGRSNGTETESLAANSA